MENITKFYIRHSTLFGKLSNTELSGRNEFGLFMKITKISDVLKEQMSWKERLTRWGGGRADEWIILAPHSHWCLTDHYNFALKNIFLSIRPVLISRIWKSFHEFLINLLTSFPNFKGKSPGNEVYQPPSVTESKACSFLIIVDGQFRDRVSKNVSFS